MNQILVSNFTNHPLYSSHKVKLLVIFLILTISARAQDKLNVSGYTSTIQSAMFDSISKQWNTENILHNRLNLKYFATNKINMALEIRNRFIYGDNLSQDPNLAVTYDHDNGLADLTKNLSSGKSYVLNSSIDRFWATYESGKFKATLGRQRINWGQTMVWNPNDIFNSYSFFDFDYSERPGSDAMRLQYYNSEVSSTELAIKINREKKLTAAALYKFNAFEYDFQVLAGSLNDEDYVLGTGWSGAIDHVAFRGEISYLHPVKKVSDTSGVFLASIGFDYTFGSSFSLLAEYLYNNSKSNGISSFTSFYSAPQTVKNLSIVQHNLVVQASYPLTPLLSASLATMYMHGIKGYYFSPSISYSLTDNVDASAFYQSFGGEIENIKQRFNLLFVRVKWCF
jgi:hypothetical protein